MSGDVIEVSTSALSTVEVGSSSPTVEILSNSGPVAYTFSQSVPATVWTIVHRLGFDPAGITVIDADGYQVDGFGTQYLAPGHSLRLAFDIPLSGLAYLS